MSRPLLLSILLAALACGTKATPEKVASGTDGTEKGENVHPSQRTKAPLPMIDVPPPSDETTRHVVEGLNRFTLDFHRTAAEREADSVLSPASIALALGMVHVGARGETAAEIAKALHVERDAKELHGAFGELLRRWNGEVAGVELSVVDRLFGDTSVAFERGYVDLTGKVFGAGMQLMNFQGAPDASRTEINAWVAGQTHDRIVDLLPDRAITSATKLVVVNAVYFKGSWVQAFDPNATKPGDFAAPKGKRSVPMMHRTGDVAHAAIPEAKLSLVHLPYVAEAMAMVVLLPDAPDGLAALEAQLDAAALDGWIGKVATRKVDLALPKLRVEMGAPLLLKAPLTSLGVQRVFDHEKADLTGIAPATEMLRIDEGYHKAFIEIDEKGTEAAAASALALGPGGPPPKQDAPVVFHADRPFLYLLRDTQTGAILFIGHVVSPSAG
jgi:serpin B